MIGKEVNKVFWLPQWMHTSTPDGGAGKNITFPVTFVHFPVATFVGKLNLGYSDEARMRVISSITIIGTSNSGTRVFLPYFYAPNNTSNPLLYYLIGTTATFVAIGF